MNSDLLLFTADMTHACDEIERIGRRVLHVLNERLLVADVAKPETLKASTTERPADLDPDSVQLAEAWNAAQHKMKAEGEIIPWDAPGFKPPG